MTAASGKLQLTVSTKASAGTKGAVYFSIGLGDDLVVFDSVAVMAVDKQKRYFLINAGDTTKVIGKHSTEEAPALQLNTGDISQLFLFQEVNPGSGDSLYYIIQDGTYKMLMKDISSSWNTVLGAPCDEAKWKITQVSDTTFALINLVTGKYLGTDGLSSDSRLYDDKALVQNPTDKPYSLWKIVLSEKAVVPELFELSDNNYVLEVERHYQSYPVEMTSSGIKETINVTASTGFSLDKNSVTPEELKNEGGKIKIRISSDTQPGNTGFIVFSKGTQPLDTVIVRSVEIQKRYYIENRSSAGLVIVIIQPAWYRSYRKKGYDRSAIYPASG
jgi:hypothetical protein